MKLLRIIVLFTVLTTSCTKEDNNDKIIVNSDSIKLAENIFTDKSRYNPGEQVEIKLELKDNNFDYVEVSFKHLSKTIEKREIPASGNTMQLFWTPPSDDFKGYSVEFKFYYEEEIISYASTAVDVSSDWTRFPRYGFLSKFSGLSKTDVTNNLEALKKYHINGLQYYDWHNKHHIPLPMNGDNPSSLWKDIAKRDISFNTVASYIDQAKEFNIASMSYNLLYGAWYDYEKDGVSPEWMIYEDQNHVKVNKHDLDDNWALSDIYVTNPANTEWQNYIFERTDTIYQFLDFDGWHLDQLGHRGDVYDYDGNKVDLWNTFTPFLKNLKDRFPEKKMVLNAVNQYGQKEILAAPVDFSYTELWEPNESYSDLAKIIQDNFNFNQDINTVLAAYMNYDMADSKGYFNDAAVLMTDAVIMAFGGTHIELGEHMLGKEYFPNNNLLMSDDLKSKLIEYYDFMVAYQNLLRDGGKLSTFSHLSSEEENIRNWPPSIGSISTFKKVVEDKTVYHLLNFNGLNSLKWRDNNGTQNKAQLKKEFILSIPKSQINKVYYASPDWHDGVQKELDFKIVGTNCEVTIPYLEYWGMLIVE